MYYILPGRHLAFTIDQARLIRQAIHQDQNPVVIFALSSANQENCRYNPIPSSARTVQIDRFAQSLGHPWQTVEIPHFPTLSAEQYCLRTLKAVQSSMEETLTPANTRILVSTTPLIEGWRSLGFSIHEMEKTLPKEFQIFPIDLIKDLAHTGNKNPGMHPASIGFFRDYPNVIKTLQRIWQDPLFNENGDLAQGRNYNTYAAGMHQNIGLKAQAILPHIKPGRIVDEGCADGSLLRELASTFPESDLIGVDGSAEMIARAKENVRAGAFGSTFSHFYCQNILGQIFEENSIDTTISNSTLHEIYSYNGYDTEVVMEYLSQKFRQTKPGGIFVARDVVGPKNQDAPASFRVRGALQPDSVPITETNYATRALRMFKTMGISFNTFIPQTPQKEDWVSFSAITRGQLMEFLHKMDYTDNWDAEVNERFCFWNHRQWKEALTKVGFQVEETSSSFPEPWLYQNRIISDRVQLQIPHGSAQLPDTHQILVARKPL